ncbi:Kunitz-type serine protease inhibitor bitisilin-3 [Thelohanellus kitauei]|uniref:Kunitz-type serine protease inhibitor bitisilin-3 n=1 Tax=Thelohanellus kitauei TaxID=669202 RepID=A0A0C2IVL1_THEKT|nr:Kunitz-type serine protease inhibitor bitisilin-3 [Thelohanellus kitauei]
MVFVSIFLLSFLLVVHIWGHIHQITDARRCNAPIPVEKCVNNNLEVRWYYDKTANKCHGFLSKSCGPNLNNFYNREECVYSCIKPKCKVLPSAGTCGGRYVIMWYYDFYDKQCKTFLYSGCGGNSNRYYDEVECYENCING